MSELKRCPFCKRKMAVDYKISLFPNGIRYGIVHANRYYAYYDDRCYGGTDYEYKTAEEAIEAWNRRVGEQDE